MTRDAPAFDFYPERWLAGVAMFSDAEQLAFLRLLCHQWMSGALPDDLAVLKRLGGGKGVTPALLLKFPLCEDGRRNARLETIRQEQRARIARKSEQRKAAANARWAKQKMPKPCVEDAVASTPHSARILPVSAEPPTRHPPSHPLLPEKKVKEPVALPFASDSFADAWAKWRKHRTEIRKPLKPTMEAAQLQELAAMGERRAIAALLHTIGKGWQGIREPEPNFQHQSYANTHHSANARGSANQPGRYS